MIRRLAIVLVPVLLALGAWLMLRQGDGEPVPGMSMEPPSPAAAALTALPPAPLAAEAATTAPAEATVVRSAAASDSDRPPLPADVKWLDVLVVDAGTQQPVAGAEVWWSDRAVYKVIEALPEADRQPYRNDSELLVRRFGRHTRSDGNGSARVATDGTVALLHAYAEGRFATGCVGGQFPVPPGGWRLELEPDCTLRAQVLDAAGQPAIGVQVVVLLPAKEGQSPAPAGAYQRTRTVAPDGIAEFRHIQLWGRVGGQPAPTITSWRVATDLPGGDDPGVAFENLSPPIEPIVLRLPATGRLSTRLLHAGQPIRENVTFCAYRGDARDIEAWNSSSRVEIDDDGWARFPYVPLGDTLTVMAWFGPGMLDGSTPGPTSAGQEVRIELTTDGLYALAGRLLGPGGKVLAKARVSTDFDLEITSGGGQITTDAEGRFLWLLGKGSQDTTRLKRLVLSQTPAEGPPLRAAVSPREMVRGVNQLGDIQLSAGNLVVAGRFAFEPPDGKVQVMFTVQRLRDRRGRNGEEQWEDLRGTPNAQRADGTFEVRGEPGAGRYRLFFPAYDHLPVAPIEFAVGKEDLVIAITKGCALAASCLPPEGLPSHLVRAQLEPNGATAAAPKQQDESPWPRGPDPDRLVSASRQQSRGRIEWTWRAVPAGLYTFTVRALGNPTPLATIENVVLPEPAGGDPRLRDIDLREHITIRKVHVTQSLQQPGNAAEDEIEGLEATVFTMPQEDQRVWHGTQVRGGVATVVAPPGPIELLVACVGMQPKRLVTAAPEVTVVLEPWPTVEVTFAGLPPLPAGFTLHASLRDRNRPRGAEPSEYRAEDQGGGQSALLQPDDSGDAVEGGRVHLPIGDGTFRLSLYLLRTEGENSRSKFLRNVTPDEIQGGPGLAPIVVQLSADEVRAAIEEMQKTPWKK